MHTTTRLLSAAILLALSTSALAAGPAERALANLRANGSAADAAQGDVFMAKSVKLDANGVSHVRFDRTYQGLRVLGGDLVVHSDRNGNIKSVSKSLNGTGRPSTTAGLASDDATIAAGLGFGGDISTIENKGLVVWAHGKKPVLAYEVSVSGWRSEGFGHDLVYVDANNGKVIGSDSIFKTIAATGTGRTLLLGNVSMTTDSAAGKFQLVDPTRGGGNTRDGGGKVIDRVYSTAPIMTDADNIWGNNTEADVASEASDAHYGVAATWDFYKNTFNRNGIYNDGVGVKSIVNVIFQSAGYRGGGNAAWYGAPYKFMAYGSGDSTWYPVVSIDVAGHEMSHGVTEAVNGLAYSGDAGGLNEASSDIMGTMVEFSTNNASDPGDYLIGEEIYRSNPNGTNALRYMYRPYADGGRSYDCYPAATFAGIDPHYSSGPANHFFYLLAEGTGSKTFGGVVHTPSTCKAGDTKQGTGTATVAGIGRDKAAAIYYRAMDLYFTSGTTYPQARAATLSAAADLYGNGSLEYNAVASAWSAVLVN